MVLGGSANFLLKVNRPYIYCLSFPLIEKKEEDGYGTHLFKIGLSTQAAADKRLDQYLTYFSPFSYEIHAFLIFPKDTRRDIIKKAEQSIFNRLHRKKNQARTFPTTARINRYQIQDKDSREWWETDLKLIESVFKEEQEYLKSKRIITYFIPHNKIKTYFRLNSRDIPREIKLSREELQTNKDEIQRIDRRAKEYLDNLPNNELRKRFFKPSDYFKIDENF